MTFFVNHDPVMLPKIASQDSLLKTAVINSPTSPNCDKPLTARCKNYLDLATRLL